MKIYVDKLPKCCVACPLHVSSLIKNEDFCSVNGAQISNDEFFNKRPKFCPLEELTEQKAYQQGLLQRQFDKDSEKNYGKSLEGRNE